MCVCITVFYYNNRKETLNPTFDYLHIEKNVNIVVTTRANITRDNNSRQEHASPLSFLSSFPFTAPLLLPKMAMTRVVLRQPPCLNMVNAFDVLVCHQRSLPGNGPGYFLPFVKLSLSLLQFSILSSSSMILQSKEILKEEKF